MALDEEPKRLDFTQILVERFKSVPAWNDLAEACNEVLTQTVENPRRQLGKVRESVKYRKGDTVQGLRFFDNKGFVVKDHKESNPANGTVIPAARVVRVLHNNATIRDEAGVDAMEVEFFVKGKRFNWVLPVEAPQERSVMIQNGFMVGFDFFNTKLSDEDYQRLYEFVAMYWPEGGTDNFMRFISFIKNIKMDAHPLWSYDDGGEQFPTLELQQPDHIPTHKGGKWYQTSHVELRYDPLAYGENRPPNLEDLEQLFFVFAPIHLVLERIVAAIDMYFDFFYSIAGQETETYIAKYHHILDMSGTGITGIMVGAHQVEVDQSRIKYEPPILRSGITLQADQQTMIIETAKDSFEIPFLRSGINVSAVHDAHMSVQRRVEYLPPILDSLLTMNGSVGCETLAYAYTEYKVQVLRPQLNLATSGLSENLIFKRKEWVPPELTFTQYKDTFIVDTNVVLFGYKESAHFGDVDYPTVISNTFNSTIAVDRMNLIYGYLDYINRQGRVINYINWSIPNECVITSIFAARAFSAKTL